MHSATELIVDHEAGL